MALFRVRMRGSDHDRGLGSWTKTKDHGDGDDTTQFTKDLFDQK